MDDIDIHQWLVEEKQYRGDDCLQRDQQGFWDLLCRRVHNRHGFCLETLSAGQLAAVRDAAFPDQIRPSRHCVRDRLRRCEEAVLAILGLDYLAFRQSYGMGTNSVKAATDLTVVETQHTLSFLPPADRRRLAALGAKWLRWLRCIDD